MADSPLTADKLQALLDDLASGKESAVDTLIARTMPNLDRLAHFMLADNPRVRRWYETGDVSNSAAMRLRRALLAVKPSSARAFTNLAAVEIRRELYDLA